eukprot:4496660-Alexandrium_andersonii.AAC.1
MPGSPAEVSQPNLHPRSSANRPQASNNHTSRQPTPVPVHSCTAGFPEGRATELPMRTPETCTLHAHT